MPRTDERTREVTTEEWAKCPVCGTEVLVWGGGRIISWPVHPAPSFNVQGMCEVSHYNGEAAQAVAKIQRENGGREVFQLRAHP